MRPVRVVTLPPEIPDRKLWVILTKYGTVKGISIDLLSRASRYPVSNGIRMVELGQKHNIPSRIVL